MNDWLHNLPGVWMALLVFGLTYLTAVVICAVITVLAVGERARSFKAVSPGLLPPLGIIFGLFVAFTAAQVWTDNEKAKTEIDREASALRSAVILANSFPGESEVQLRALIRRYIADVATQEWPMMAHRSVTLIYSNGHACSCRHSALWLQLPWSTATTGLPLVSQWGSSRPG